MRMILDKISNFDRFFAGPVITLMLLFAGHVLTDFFPWLTPTLTFPAIVGLSASALLGGMRAGFISAALITAYGFISPDFDLARAITVAAGCFLGAYLQGLLKRWLIQQSILAQANQRAADLVKAANGNIKLLKRAHKRISDLYAGWDILTDVAKKELVAEIRGILASLLTLIAGWEHLAAERRRVIEDIDESAPPPDLVQAKWKPFQDAERKTGHWERDVEQPAEGSDE